MKTNVLKSGLAAFAFTLAIVASFAFSAPPVAIQKYQDNGICKTVPVADRVNESQCKTIHTAAICTTTINGVQGIPVYSLVDCIPGELLREEF